ncbi:DUF2797 domain-containing protein [Actinacidiphila acidipaludis]|uniref:DUF2797 domain-containing protein n=1 Tax=Actinacidiphila acidipaludis TaxID=2873382 RepID=A0ABS7Q428_9ACTN|nr:DUF2797 domain-containing protein [Streptomyces acidipaludis]MBY8877713.1 DUF2797 domain-containing protein [Streptomyces acidipaludis]
MSGNGQQGQAGRRETGAGWRAGGMGWRDGEAVMEWVTDGRVRRSRASGLLLGAEPAFRVGEDRRCLGVWRAGRRVRCVQGAVLPPQARSGQCAECAVLDRSNSIAADTRPDDPRTFAVYLAHHGSAVKVGITGAGRGSTRLLEQGALASLFLSSGTLMSARRSEHVLGAALGLPDRVATERKRDARRRPGTADGRAAELRSLAARVRALSDWPPAGQQPRDPQVTDHAAAYGLPGDGLHPRAAVAPLSPGAVVAGRIACRIGTDLYLEDAGDAPGLVLLDTRRLTGWSLEPSPPGARRTARLDALPNRPQHDAEPLF